LQGLAKVTRDTRTRMHVAVLNWRIPSSSQQLLGLVIIVVIVILLSRSG
jgi:hypothetical protein